MIKTTLLCALFGATTVSSEHPTASAFVDFTADVNGPVAQLSIDSAHLGENLCWVQVETPGRPPEAYIVAGAHPQVRLGPDGRLAVSVAPAGWVSRLSMVAVLP